MERAKAFYEGVLEVKLTEMPIPGMEDLEMWGFPSDSESWGCSGTLVKMKGMAPSGISTIVYFATEDCSVEEKRVPQFGGKIHTPKMSIGQYGFITLAFDTEGNMFGLHSMT